MARFSFQAVSELLVPHPVVRLLRLHNLVVHQLVDNVHIMNQVQNQSLDFAEKQTISLVVKLGVGLQLLLQVLLVISKLSGLDCFDCVLTESHHLGEAADLRGHVHDIETRRTLKGLPEQGIKSNPHYLLKVTEPNLNIDGDLDGSLERYILLLR